MGGPDEQTHRLFVAVPLPKRLIRFTARAQEALPRTGGLRLVDQSQLHCTLAFIGQVDFEKAEAAKAVVAGLQMEGGGEAAVDGFLFLPNARRARVVALRIVDRSGVLERLYEAVTVGLAGVMEREKRPFCAHVTIARLRRPGPVQPTSDCGQAAFAVESVCLYESKLLREGAVHTVLIRRDLQRAYGRKMA